MDQQRPKKMMLPDPIGGSGIFVTLGFRRWALEQLATDFEWGPEGGGGVGEGEICTLVCLASGAELGLGRL